MKHFWKAAGTSVGLSALFLVVYGSCNWITSLRPHVGSFYFQWEHAIPFVPLMILPYMSIDLFFVAAPFVARSDRERRTLAGRLLMAIVIAGACFLIHPLRFAFSRPHVDGLLGGIFNNFRSLDLPFNEFPSLHIALWAILLDIYFRRTRGFIRWILVAWFVLIALSPLLTYQHHVVDILGGFALAVLCFHFVADEPLRQPFAPNYRIAFYYGGGASLIAVLAFARFPWTGILLWPAFSLALVATGYLFAGPGIYRKKDLRHAWTTGFLLGPVILGQRLSLMYYARQCRSHDRLTEHLWIGRKLSAREASMVRAAGVLAVIDLCGEFSESRPLRDLDHLQLSVLDLTAPTPRQIDRGLAFIRHHTRAGIVYLHCKAGYSRTAAMAGAYLLATGQADSVDGALQKLRQCRPSMVVRAEAVAALQAFHAVQVR